MKKIAAILLVMTLFLGCSLHKAEIKRQPLFGTADNLQPTLFWARYDATQRGGLYLVNPIDSKTVEIKVISEPPPDAGLISTIEGILKVKVTDQVDVGAKFSAITSVAELGKRNAANYMVRDIAFRIETLKNNDGSIDTQIVELYKLLIASAEKISIAESEAEMSNNKLETLQEINKLLVFAKDTNNNDLGLDSNFFNAIELLIK